MKRPRRRNTRSSEEVTLEGLKTLSELAPLIEEVRKALDIQAEEALAVQTALDMNFWIQVRTQRTQELTSLDADSVVAHVELLQALYFSCSDIASFLEAPVPKTPVVFDEK